MTHGSSLLTSGIVRLMISTVLKQGQWLLHLYTASWCDMSYLFPQSIFEVIFSFSSRIWSCVSVPVRSWRLHSNSSRITLRNVENLYVSLSYKNSWTIFSVQHPNKNWHNKCKQDINGFDTPMVGGLKWQLLKYGFFVDTVQKYVPFAPK